MSPDQLSRAKDDLIANTPVRHTAAVREISLEEKDGAGMLAPYASTRRKAITIPDGFRKLQCQLVLLQFFLHRQKDDRIFRGIKDIVDTCVAKSIDTRRCVHLAMDAFEAINAPAWDRLAKEDRDTVEAIVRAAFRHLLLHEVAHLVLGHRPEQGRDQEALQELEADEYAVVGTMLAGGPAMGAFSTFATLSLLDHRVDWSKAPHQTSACRAWSVQNVIRRLYRPMAALLILQGGSAADFRTARDENDGMAEVSLMTGGQIEALRLRPCRELPADRLDAVSRDLTALVERVARLGDGVPETSDAPGMLALMNVLRSVPVSTSVAARVRESVISVRFFSGATRQTGDRFDPVAEQAVEGDGHHDWTSADYGRYLYLRAVAIFADSPAGSSLATVVEDTRSLAARAVFHNPGLASSHALLSEVEYMSGRCAEAELSGRRALATASEPDKFSERIGVREQLYRARGCPVVQETLNQVHRSRAGWQ